MRLFIIFTSILLSAAVTYAQPTASKVVADVKKDFGADCLSVAVVSAGNTSTESVNGGLSSFYRVSVNVKLKTELPGVTKLLKGAAKYGYNGSGYFYKQYAPGSTEYLGLPKPDTAAIRSFILSLSDYGLEGYASVILDVKSINFNSSLPPIWHSLESVSIPAEMVYTSKANNTTIETFRHPFALRLYRSTASGPWISAGWGSTQWDADKRLKEMINTEKMGEYTVSQLTSVKQRAEIRAAENRTAAMPKVEIPVMNSIAAIQQWYHGLLMEGNYEKLEAATVQLMHPFNFDATTKLMNYNGTDMLNRIKKAISNDYSVYNKQYCTNPIISSSDANSISWWNKDKSTVSSIDIKQENGRWFLYKVEINYWDDSFQSRAQATMGTACR